MSSFRRRLFPPPGCGSQHAHSPGLPLDGGRITCVTCHQGQHLSAAGQRTARLRDGLTATELCLECHTSREHSAKAMHPIALGRAHPGKSDKFARRSLQIDAETRTCLSCHDGTMASDIGVGDSTGLSHAGHPVGVVYRGGGFPQASATGSTGGYGQLRPASILDSRIRLFDQQVGCGSCHTPYAQGERAPGHVQRQQPPVPQLPPGSMSSRLQDGHGASTLSPERTIRSKKVPNPRRTC